MSFPSDELPSRDSAYLGQFHCMFEGTNWLIRGPSHSRFTMQRPAPDTVGLTQTHDFQSRIAFKLGYRITLGRWQLRLPLPLSGRAGADVSVTVKLESKDPTGTVRHLTTELKKLDSAPIVLKLGPFSRTAVIRLSDRTKSPGVTTVSRRPDGRFDITSHFDVATKVSFDDGVTWHHSEDRKHRPCTAPMDLAPSPYRSEPTVPRPPLGG